MGQQVSCPCSTGDNVDFDSVDSDSAAAVNARKNNSAAVYVSTNPPTVDPASTNPFDEREEDDKVTPIGIKVKSRRWKARTEDAADFSSNSAQRSGEEVSGERDGEGHTSENLGDAMKNVKGELGFSQADASGSGKSKKSSSNPVMETEVQRVAREKLEAHNDRIIATFNSVMLADGLKVLKHHRRSSKKAASRVIRFVPDYGGALVWDKPLRQPGAKASRVPLDAINQVELEQRIVWISAGDERVGFETSKVEDADLMYRAICILVDRCHA